MVFSNEISDTSEHGQCGLIEPRQKALQRLWDFQTTKTQGKDQHLKNSNTLRGDPKRTSEKQAAGGKKMDYRERQKPVPNSASFF